MGTQRDVGILSLFFAHTEMSCYLVEYGSRGIEDYVSIDILEIRCCVFWKGSDVEPGE